MPKRVLILAADGVLPGPTYSGPAVIRWGLIEGLRANGAEVAYYSSRRFRKEPFPVTANEVAERMGRDRFWVETDSDPDAQSKSLATAIETFAPDVILAYGPPAMKILGDGMFAGPIGIMSVDLEFLPRLYKLSHYLRAGDYARRRKAIKGLPRTVRSTLDNFRDVRAQYPRADFIVNHAAHHAAWHRRKHGVRTLYTPNPVARIFDSRPAHVATTPPRFMLLGGLAGTATLSGLEWFADRVYPRLEAHIRAGELDVHLVGRLEMPTPMHQRMPLVVQRGYVDDLELELRHTTAVLVPTPIKLGFRTRILDAFRHGVTVVAHSANALGMPEMIDGQNARVARGPRDFADAVLYLAKHPEEAQRLGEQAFAEFDRDLNADAVAAAILQFVDADSAKPSHATVETRHA